MKILSKLGIAAAIGACLGVAPAIAADNFPTRPVELIVPFAAGGGTDIAARLVAHYLGQELGGNVVVVNKEGAGGEVGLGELAHSQPDGYQLGSVNMPGFIAIPIQRQAQYAWTDFEMIGSVGGSAQVLAVPADSPFQSLQDYIDHAKANPGKVTIGTAGVASSGDFVAMFIENGVDVQLRRIPFQGTGPASIAVMAGEVMSASFALTEALEFAKSGKLRVLGQMAAERSPMMPDVPTFAEQGLDIEFVLLRGYAVPKGVPADIVEKYRTAFDKLFDNPEFVARAEEAKLNFSHVTAQQLHDRLSAFDAELRKLRSEGIWK